MKENTKITKPFLKWTGGKTQILGKILPLIPVEMVNYHEPFLGGGSVLLAILTMIENKVIKLSGKIYASDNNDDLIYLYKNIQENPFELIACTREIIEEYRKHSDDAVFVLNAKKRKISNREIYYLDMRTKFNELKPEDRSLPSSSAIFLFLNKTCFRGMYRESSNGFNVSYGNYKNPIIMDDNHILEISQLIRNVVFEVKSFEKALELVKSGDFIYMDPPYVPVMDTLSENYIIFGFSSSSHDYLFKRCRKMAKLGIKFILSNSNTKKVCDAFTSSDCKIEVISCRRVINVQQPSCMVDEILVRNF